MTHPVCPQRVPRAGRRLAGERCPGRRSGHRHLAAQRFQQVGQQLLQLTGGDGHIGVKVVVLVLAGAGENNVCAEQSGAVKLSLQSLENTPTGK